MLNKIDLNCTKMSLIEKMLQSTQMLSCTKNRTKNFTSNKLIIYNLYDNVVFCKFVRFIQKAIDI